MYNSDGGSIITKMFSTGSMNLTNGSVVEASESLNLHDGSEITVHQSVIRVKSLLGVDLTVDTQEAQAMKKVLEELGATVSLTDGLMHISGNYSFTKETLLDEYQTELLAIKGHRPAFAP